MFCRVTDLLASILSLSLLSEAEAYNRALTGAELAILEAEIADMDFMDASVPVHDMKEKLVKRMPMIYEDVIDERVLEYEPSEE